MSTCCLSHDCYSYARVLTLCFGVCTDRCTLKEAYKHSKVVLSLISPLQPLSHYLFCVIGSDNTFTALWPSGTSEILACQFGDFSFLLPVLLLPPHWFYWVSGCSGNQTQIYPLRRRFNGLLMEYSVGWGRGFSCLVIPYGKTPMYTVVWIKTVSSRQQLL